MSTTPETATEEDSHGLAYFDRVFQLTSHLDGVEVIRGFVAGLKEGANNE